MKTRKLRRGGQQTTTTVSNNRPSPRPAPRPAPRPSPRPSPRPAPRAANNYASRLASFRTLAPTYINDFYKRYESIQSNLTLAQEWVRVRDSLLNNMNLTINQVCNDFSVWVEVNVPRYRVAPAPGVAAAPQPGSSDVITTIVGPGVTHSESDAYGWWPGIYDSGNPPNVDGPFGIPNAVVVAPNGDMYISDVENNRILLLEADTGFVTTMIGRYDGGSPTLVNKSTILNGVSGLALDAQGNLFIADTNNHVIRRVRRTERGISTPIVVAGNGTAGFSGDGGSATMAKLNSPRGVAIDRSGNLLILDSLNKRIRKVSPNGIITTAT